MKSFLIYWRPKTVDHESGRDGPLNHSGSEQFDRVSVGDDVWVATVRNGDLRVVGCIKVGYVGGRDGAASMLGEDNLWEATLHIVSARGTAGRLKEISIGVKAAALRFVSRTKDRLTVVDGHVDPRQLQTMRELNAESARELEKAFNRG